MVGIATTRGGVIALPISSSTAPDSDSSIELKPLEGYESYGGVRLYVYDGAIVELMRYEQAHGSWMYITTNPDTTEVDIEPNGYLTMVTTVDPLFVALGIMVGRSQRSGMFEPKENLLDNKNGTVLFCDADLLLLCDTKSAGDESFYRFSPEKARRWLDAKVLNIAELAELEAASIIAQYLPDSWAEELLDKYVAATKAEQKADINITDSNISDAQKMALAAMQSDVQAENEAATAAEAAADSEPPKKKKKVSNKKPVTRSRNPITSFFKKK